MSQAQGQEVHVNPDKLKSELARGLATRKIEFKDAAARVRRAGLNGSEASMLATLAELEGYCARAQTRQAKNRIIYMVLCKHPKQPTAVDFL
jgi:hypothetical protein